MFRFVLLAIFCCCSFVDSIQVCKGFNCYVYPDRNSCYNNPDGERNLTEIVKSWSSVTVEEYFIYTDDGYKIFILRVYKSKEKDSIVLGHGQFITPFGWVNRGEKSLAHFLVEQGHDVWIINFRGSEYSKGHKTLSCDEADYWKFSFYEMGVYDLDSTLELVMEKTNKKALYIGYSVGSTAGYVYGSIKSSKAKENLKGMISLGPLAYMDAMKSYLRFILPVVEYLKPVICQRLHGEIPLDMEYANCSSLMDMYLFEVARMPLYGDDFSEIEPKYLPLIKTQNTPASIGVNVLVHLSQIMRAKKFQAYDFGSTTNLNKYGSKTPPPFDLGNIPVPVSLFVGDNDWLATKDNARRIYSELGPSMQCGFNLIDCDKWNHNDFIEAKDVEELLYISLYKTIIGMCQEICLNLI